MVWNTVSGDYDVAANWSNQSDNTDHHVPIGTADAQINTASVTVTHSSGVTDSVHSLTGVGSFTFSAGTLNVAGNMGLTGTVKLSGGTLAGATVPATTTLTATTSGGTLSGSNLQGTLN